MPASESAPATAKIKTPSHSLPSPLQWDSDKIKASLAAPRSSALSENSRDRKSSKAPPTQSHLECVCKLTWAQSYIQAGVELVRIALEGYVGMTREWWCSSCPKMWAQFVRNEKSKARGEVLLSESRCFLLIHLIASGFLGCPQLRSSSLKVTTRDGCIRIFFSFNLLFLLLKMIWGWQEQPIS